jgi:hypothetical protein
MPFSKVRREVLTRFVITCGMGCGLFYILPWKLPEKRKGDDHFLKTVLRTPEGFNRLKNNGTVGGRIHSARRVAEILLHHAFLALRALRQHRAEFSGR